MCRQYPQRIFHRRSVPLLDERCQRSCHIKKSCRVRQPPRRIGSRGELPLGDYFPRVSFRQAVLGPRCVLLGIPIRIGPGVLYSLGN